MLILNKNILTIGGNRLEGEPLTPPTPVDPYNPLGLPPNTVRVRTSDGNAPYKDAAQYETATLVAGTSDVYTPSPSIFLSFRTCLEVFQLVAKFRNKVLNQKIALSCFLIL